MNHFMFVIVCIACIRQAISIGSSFYVSVTSFKLNKSNFFTDFVHFAFAIHKIQMVFTISFMFCDLPHLPFDIFPCIFAIKQKQNYSNVSIASWSAYDIKFVHFSWIEFIHLTSRPLQNSSSQSTDYFFSFTFFRFVCSKDFAAHRLDIWMTCQQGIHQLPSETTVPTYSNRIKLVQAQDRKKQRRQSKFDCFYRQL